MDVVRHRMMSNKFMFVLKFEMMHLVGAATRPGKMALLLTTMVNGQQDGEYLWQISLGNRNWEFHTKPSFYYMARTHDANEIHSPCL